MKKYCFDLDGVICNNTNGDYVNAQPFLDAVKKINSLYEEGNEIIIFTARYMGRNDNDISKAYNEGYELTRSQLEKWKVNYHKLILGKPEFDILVDDKSFNYTTGWINDENF